MVAIPSGLSHLAKLSKTLRESEALPSVCSWSQNDDQGIQSANS